MCGSTRCSSQQQWLGRYDRYCCAAHNAAAAYCGGLRARISRAVSTSEETSPGTVILDASVLVETRARLLQSHQLARRVAERLGLERLQTIFHEDDTAKASDYLYDLSACNIAAGHPARDQVSNIVFDQLRLVGQALAAARGEVVGRRYLESACTLRLAKMRTDKAGIAQHKAFCGLVIETRPLAARRTSRLPCSRPGGHRERARAKFRATRNKCCAGKTSSNYCNANGSKRHPE